MPRMDNNIPLPGPGMNVTKTVISVGADRLLLTIHATPDSEHVYLGSAERFYAYTQVIHPSSPFYAAMGHSDATLVRIQYNMVNMTMLVALMVAIIRERYPSVAGLQFTDMSYRMCGSETATLTEMYYIATGSTWYEIQFGAYLMDDEAAANFMVKTARFQEKKLLIPWISMKQEMQVPLSFPVPDEELRQMYDNAATWQEFFGPLRSRIGEDEFCMFVGPWLHRFY